MGFPTGKKSIEALASNSSLVSQKEKWTTELIVNFVPLPPEKEEAYWAAIQYFAEIMFADLLEDIEQEYNESQNLSELGASN